MNTLIKYRCNVCGSLFEVVESKLLQKDTQLDEKIFSEVKSATCPNCNSSDITSIEDDYFHNKSSV